MIGPIARKGKRFWTEDTRKVNVKSREKENYTKEYRKYSIFWPLAWLKERR